MEYSPIMCSNTHKDWSLSQKSAQKSTQKSRIWLVMRKVALVLACIAIIVSPVFARGNRDAKDGERVDIRWYVGLGAGSDEPTFVPQQAVVDTFNQSQDSINLILEIVDADQAHVTLATQIAAGNAPDIVGPVGIKGRDGFKGSWLDLTDLVAQNNYDLTQFDSKMIDFYRTESGLEGLPFAVYPSFYYINYELFDEAGLPYPPQEYGQPYVDDKGNELPWNLETIAYIAQRLTVDVNGNDATSRSFDPENIVQFGFGQQYTDWRGAMTSFGPGSIHDENGDAQIPQNWAAATRYYYDSMWESFFTPNGAYGNADFLANGDWFASGNIAIVHTHLWYAGFANLPFEWDTAAVAAHPNGTTAKMHADTFEIIKTTPYPEEAFAVVTYLLGEASGDLLKIYGGMPARLSAQQSFFQEFAAEKFPGRNIDWSVVTDSIAYADNPNHESWMPSFQETTTVYNDFWAKIQNTSGLDMDEELSALQRALQAVFVAAK